MNTSILNRAGDIPSDGWYEIETPGEHLNQKARVLQILDETAFAAIAQNFAAEASRPGFPGLLVDQDHFSLDPSKSSEAMGWLLEMRNRAGRLEGRIEWTDIGAPAVKTKRYKFFSTVYAPSDAEIIGRRAIDNITYTVARPRRLDRLALTNDPNNKGGKPISNRDEREEHHQQTNTMIARKVTEALGLPEDASEDAVVEAILQLKSSATAAKSAEAAITNRLRAVEAERALLLAAQVETDLDKYAHLIANRDAFRAQLVANRAGTLAILASLDLPAKAKEKPAPARITNRSDARTPAISAAGDDDDKADQAAAARAARITNRAREIRQATPGIPLAAAYQSAQAEIDAAAATA